MAQARGNAHVAATAVLIMVTISIVLNYCEAAGVDWTYGGTFKTQRVMKGGSIMFNYKGSAHNAVLVGKDGTCKSDGVGTPGPATVTFPTAGTFYVICSVPRHCTDGKMKVQVIVS